MIKNEKDNFKKDFPIFEKRINNKKLTFLDWNFYAYNTATSEKRT